MLKWVIAVGVATLLGGAPSRGAGPTMQAPVAGAEIESRAEDVVVIARRSGAPVWRVSLGGRSIVLVGVIEGVSAETKWDPASLERALAKADQLTFPDTQGVAVSPFALIAYYAKWRRHATLPDGRTLAQLLTPDQYARLVELRRRGILGAGFERRHPFHLALSLRGKVKGRGFGPDASQVARRIAKKQRIHIAPLAETAAKPLAAELFQSRPEDHVRCLMDAVALAEAGPAAVRERSDAWAERRVPASLGSVAERVYGSCWPAGSAFDVTPERGLTRSIRQLLAGPRLTVAMVSLASLAKPGGVLDEFARSGALIDGPAWRQSE
jgi:uncharacterized protein YbaP (TraB family)